VSKAFYEADGDRWIPSELTRGPWDPKAQHASPPAALIAREIEKLGGGRTGGGEGPPAQVARITYEIMRPVPIAPLRLEAEVVRPGRNVEMVEAALSDDEGPVVLARGWRLRQKEVELDPEPEAPPAPPGPAEAKPGPFIDTGQNVGYHSAMEYRFIQGSFLEPGPATVWMRMRVPLVAGEEPTPLQRVMAAADTGNGVSAVLDFDRYLYINVDLSVHLGRMPEGEWICLDAATHPEPNGIGLTETVLRDVRGPIGRATQTLLIDKR
jgi:hypothetical protein